MADTPRVLRTVYLPADVDERLRVMAFRLKRTKGDLIVEWVKQGLAAMAKPAEPNL